MANDSEYEENVEKSKIVNANGTVDEIQINTQSRWRRNISFHRKCKQKISVTTGNQISTHTYTISNN